MTAVITPIEVVEEEELPVIQEPPEAKEARLKALSALASVLRETGDV